MPVVTIARQLGSGGEEIARALAERLGANLFDHELLTLAAERAGIPVEHLEALDERGRSMLWHPSDLMRLVPLPPINPDLPDVYGDRYPPTGPVLARGDGLVSPMYWAAEAYAALVSRTTQAVAAAGNAVIVGRGGSAALAGVEGVVHVLVIADESVRVRRVMTEQQLDDYEALTLVRRSDRERRRYIRQFFGAEWLDARRYDLVVRTDALSTAAAVDSIAGAVGQAAPAQPAPAPALVAS